MTDDSRTSMAGPVGRLLTTEQLAEYLGDISTRTLEDWRRQGLGPDFITLSAKMVRYRPEAVDAWLDSRTRKAAARDAQAERHQDRAYMREAQRRSRGHKAGNHSLCLPGRCPDASQPTGGRP
jgi:predicted DNA-binding transcriptional regulator AlpA